MTLKKSIVLQGSYTNNIKIKAHLKKPHITYSK